MVKVLGDGSQKHKLNKNRIYNGLISRKYLTCVVVKRTLSSYLPYIDLGAQLISFSKGNSDELGR